jgi:OmpA-OmpF porin, OOP family
MTRAVPAVAIFVCSLAFACGAAPKQAGSPGLPGAGSDGTYSPDWPELGTGEARYIAIDLGPDSLESCRRVSPKFPFDSAKTRAQDRAELAALASCLNHPSMVNRKILLVGRTDPRGGEGYNKELGEKRADRIRELLVKDGIAVDRIRTKSAGEKDAVGDTPEFSFGYDRRVDIVVSGGTHAP